jgi:hypothetical protein
MIKRKIQKDQIDAMKSGEKDKLEVLRYILSQIKYAEIEKDGEMTDNDVVTVLRKQLKELRESIEGYEKGGRDDLVKENKFKYNVISEYMPAEMSDEDLKSEIDKIIDKNKDLYESKPQAIIGICVKELKSKADPARITRILKSHA